MYKFVAKNNICSCRPVIVKNQKKERALDVVQDDFVINKFGHIRSDFAVLTDTCDSQEFARALSQMQASYESSSSQFDGMTFEQMVSSVRPRWCQLPGEVDRFEQYLIDNALDFYKKLRQDEIDVLEDEGADPSKLNEPARLGPVPAPSPAPAPQPSE